MSDAGALAAVAAGGSRKATLEVLRDRLAVDLDRCDSARDVAALSQRLMDVLAQIDAVGSEPERKGTPLDELARRRTPVGSNAKGKTRGKSAIS